jgi:RNA polymerase sigma-70 factor, ECF subfamily
VVGLPYADIAARSGVAVGTVKSRIHRAHARLAAALLAQRDTEPSAPARPPTKQ